MADAISRSSLPHELYYAICNHVYSRHDLRALAATARTLQRPAEAALHREVVLPSRNAVITFCATLHACPRFAPLVRELTFEWPDPTASRTGLKDSDEYWGDVYNALRAMTALETLVIEDGRDMYLSWILKALRPGQLKVLRCPFVLDAGLLDCLRTQTALEELSWTGAIIALPPVSASSSGDNFLSEERQARAHASSVSSCEFEHNEECFDDPDAPLSAVLRYNFPPSALPRLRILHAESIALARVLVPGRPISHLWVPGASFGAAYASDYTYRHLTSVTPINPGPSSDLQNPRTSPGVPQQPAPLLFHSSGPPLDLAPAVRAAHLRRAFHTFARSTGPLLSLRIALDLPPIDLRDVLKCAAHALPQLRALGYLPICALEASGCFKSGADLGIGNNESSTTPLPYFPHLHTLSLWSTPSRRALNQLEKASSFPALRTLACLHFSPSFEWVCLPVNDTCKADGDHGHGHSTGTSANENEKGGVRWEREACSSEAGACGCRRRRPTAVHDPENMLWRDV